MKEQIHPYSCRNDNTVESNPACNTMPIKNLALTPMILLLAFLAGSLLLLAGACSDQSSLSIDDPDELEVTYDTFIFRHGNGMAINNSNIMVGSQTVPQNYANVNRAIRWSVQNGRSFLNGLEEHTRAFGINDRGEIVGEMETNFISKGFLHVEGTLTELKKINNDDRTFAHSINNRGTIVGVTIKDRDSYMVVWHRKDNDSYGIPEVLGRISYSHESTPYINNKGEIAAVLFDSATMDFRAAIVQPDENGRYGAPFWLGAVEGNINIGGINDSGVVVGSQWIWLPENYDEPISIHFGRAKAINNHNQIVGHQQYKPTLWTIESDGQIKTQSLEIQNKIRGTAHSINDNGWITGHVWEPPLGARYAAIWRPVD